MKNDWSVDYQITTDGERIFYRYNFSPEQVSHQNVLIFNYGLVCSHQHYEKQIDFLSALGHPILLHDYRGHYQSSGIDRIEAITFENLASDLFEITQTLNINHLTLIGHSMGVNVCLEYAKRFPDQVEKMVLIAGTIIPVFNIMLNSNTIDFVNPIARKLLKKFPKAFDKLWKTGGKNPLVKKIISDGGFNMDEVPKEYIELYVNKLGSLGPEIFFQLINEMHDHDILSFIHDIKAPALIIGGDQDKVIPNFLQRLLHKELAHSSLYIIRNGSHVPQVDFPDLVNERVKLFLGDPMLQAEQTSDPSLT